MNTEVKPKLYQFGHKSMETALVVHDYPWGFRLRTKIRYWVESSPRADGGQRFCSQTINPKTGCWCAPKKSTYSCVVIIYLDENDHIQAEHLGIYCTGEQLLEFKNRHWDRLDEFQKDAIRFLIAREDTMKHVVFEIRPCPIGPVSLFSNKPEDIAKREAMIKYQEEDRKEQNEIKGKICSLINQRYAINKKVMK